MASAGCKSALLFTLMFVANASAETGQDDKRRYDACLAMAGSNPAGAFGVAAKWIQEHGGAPAEHCSAVALVGLKHYAEAAAKLDALGGAPDVGALRASLLDQAGNAWLLAGDATHAVTSFRNALTVSANDPDLYADLARAQALTKDWRGVEQDLNAALAIDARRADLLVLRASARQALNNYEGARADLSQAFKLGVKGEIANSAYRLQTALDEAASQPALKPAAKKKPPATPPAH